MVTDPREIPVLRAAIALGWIGIGRLVVFVFLGVATCYVLFLWRSDLLRPGDIGTDASNYYAAALRLLSGSPLYSLSPGDRPVPADNPPYWSVPLLSPPPIAVAWVLPAALMPGSPVMYLWWAGGAIGALGTAVFANRGRGRRAAGAQIGLVILAPAIALTAISGNVNAWLMPAYLLVFVASDRPATRASDAVLALAAGTAAAIKLSPVLLIWWLIVRGRSRAAAAAVMVSAAWVALSAVVAPGSLFAYLDVSRQTVAAGATSSSATGLAHALGLPVPVAAVAPLGCLVAAGLGALALRRRPFAAALLVVLGTVYATPVVRNETYALVAAAIGYGVAAVAPSCVAQVSRPRTALVGAGAVGILAVIGWSWFAPESSVTIRNESSQSVVVRFSVPFQSATFGYRVQPGQMIRAFTAAPGGLVAPVTVYGSGCAPLGTVVPPTSGGLLTFSGTGGVSFAPDPGVPAPLVPYTDDCAVGVARIGASAARGTRGDDEIRQVALPP